MLCFTRERSEYGMLAFWGVLGNYILDPPFCGLPWSLQGPPSCSWGYYLIYRAASLLQVSCSKVARIWGTPQLALAATASHDWLVYQLAGVPGGIALTNFRGCLSSCWNFCNSSGKWHGQCRMLLSLAAFVSSLFFAFLRNLVKRVKDCEFQAWGLYHSVHFPRMIQSQVVHLTGVGGASQRSWFLLHEQVSSTCLVALLGVGNCRLNRILQGKPDFRRSFAGEPCLTCWLQTGC